MAGKVRQSAGTTAVIRPGERVPKGVKVLWAPHSGPQSEVLLREEDEILFGGARGGGKTAAGIAWLIKGNAAPTGPLCPEHPSFGHPTCEICARCRADISYINHPGYRALVLRVNINDLADWIDKAKRIYEPLGADYAERPVQCFKFPSTAKVILGHLADPDAYSKYQGQEFQRLLLEEATLVPDYRSYAMVRASIRSVYPEMKSQTLLTSNPGGAGHSWVRDRFIFPKDAEGNIVPPGQTVYEYFGEDEPPSTRVFIPSKLSDNPTLLADPSYKRRLMALPPAERRAMLDGDWNALSGIFFDEFRPRGPLVGEPETARHVIPARDMSPWLTRWVSMDWGYAHDAAVYWFTIDADGRVHAYREFVTRQMGAEAFGAEIARRSLEDLRGLEDHTMPLYLSPDAWDKRNDTRHIAEQIAAGIQMVLGPGSVDVDNSEFTEAVQRENEFRRNASIVIRKATNQRKAGALYIRSLLRFWPLSQVEKVKYDHSYAMQLLIEYGQKRMEEYQRACRVQQENELLPRLLIHDCCKRLIGCLESLIRDEDDPEDVLKQDGDDPYDGFRYGCMAHRREKQREPFQVFHANRLAEIEQSAGGPLDGNTKVWIARKAEEDYRRGSGLSTPFMIPRAGGRRAKYAVQ